jgi:hypothetical protein
MARSDSSEVDAAITALLLNDPTLQTILPDGVYFDVGAQESQRFILIQQITQRDEPQFDDANGGIAWEEYRYAIQAIALNSTGADVKRAAQRIHELLQDNPDLGIVGYSTMRVQRDTSTGRIRFSEVDPENTSIRWQHRGAHYLVMVCPTGTVIATTGQPTTGQTLAGIS